MNSAMNQSHGHTAHGEKSRVAAISVFASAGMAAAKFVVGVLIGSLALISEALHSSVDVVATVVTWMVVRVSDLPADAEHHYGHGKLESISALGVIAMLYVLAGGILVEAYSRIREGAPPPTISAIPFVVLLVDIAVNLWRARALQSAARETKSQALAADALHGRNAGRPRTGRRGRASHRCDPDGAGRGRRRPLARPHGRADAFHRCHRKSAAYLSDRPRRGDQAQGAGGGQQGTGRRRPHLHRGSSRARQ